MSGPTHRPTDVERLRERLRSYMAEQGLRSTEQRRLIIDTFFEVREHITIDQLLALVRSDDTGIGYATVYRTLKMLSEAGVALERKFGDGFTRYELADTEAHHDHLICLDCGRIVEFEEEAIEQLQERVAARHGLAVRYHKLELYCVCTNASCPHRPRANTNAGPADGE
jgi:Fur family ferric uptake transcriptional regulator